MIMGLICLPLVWEDKYLKSHPMCMITMDNHLNTMLAN